MKIKIFGAQIQSNLINFTMTCQIHPKGQPN